MEHVRLNLGNVIIVTTLAVVGVGAVGAGSEYLAQLNIPVVQPIARGIRKFLGWSYNEAAAQPAS